MNLRLQKIKTGSHKESSCSEKYMQYMYVCAELHANNFLRTSRENYMTFVQIFQ
jgi:hypothetical protein